MIKIENLKYSYGKKEVLNIDYFEILDGEKIAIMGLNGAGKTTLAETILQLHKKYKGTIQIDRPYIYNAVFQDANFHADISLKEIFYLYCKIYNIKENHMIHFEKFGLTNIQNNKFKKISGGQQQKFKFLISLLNKPNFLVLDEIATSLDYEWRTKIITVVHEYVFKEDDINVLLISHNPEEVAKICERVILLKDGYIEKDIQLSGNYNQKIKKIRLEMNLNV